MPSRAQRERSDRRRALRLLADAPEGVTEALMLAHGVPARNRTHRPHLRRNARDRGERVARAGTQAAAEETAELTIYAPLIVEFKTANGEVAGDHDTPAPSAR